jgi:hypothetical protein
LEQGRFRGIKNQQSKGIFGTRDHHLFPGKHPWGVPCAQIYGQIILLTAGPGHRGDNCPKPQGDYVAGAMNFFAIFY